MGNLLHDSFLFIIYWIGIGQMQEFDPVQYYVLLLVSFAWGSLPLLILIGLWHPVLHSFAQESVHFLIHGHHPMQYPKNLENPEYLYALFSKRKATSKK